MEHQHQAMMRIRLWETRGEERAWEPPGDDGAPKKTLVGNLEVMQEDDEWSADWSDDQFFDERRQDA